MRGHPQLCVRFLDPPHTPSALSPPSVPHPLLPNFSLKSNLIFPFQIQIEIKNTIVCNSPMLYRKKILIS